MERTKNKAKLVPCTKEEVNVPRKLSNSHYGNLVKEFYDSGEPAGKIVDHNYKNNNCLRNSIAYHINRFGYDESIKCICKNKNVYLIRLDK